MSTYIFVCMIFSPDPLCGFMLIPLQPIRGY